MDIILREQSVLLKEIENEMAKKKKRENSIHHSIQEKMKKETGDVNYYSWRKNKQLEFRIDKAEQYARSQTKSFIKDQAIQQNLAELEKDYKLPNI